MGDLFKDTKDFSGRFSRMFCDARSELNSRSVKLSGVYWTGSIKVTSRPSSARSRLAISEPIQSKIYVPICQYVATGADMWLQKP